MRAAVFHRAASALSIEQVPEPRAQGADLVIAVKSCGICGSDLHMADVHTPDGGVKPLPAGTVMGHEFCGEVVEVGPEVRGRWQPGDRVTALPYIACGQCQPCLSGIGYRCDKVRYSGLGDLPGAYAEFLRVGAAEALRLPPGVDYRLGALVEPLAVGLHALRLAAPRPGARILVLGAGAVGLAVAACARTLTAGPVFVAARSERRAELARRLGATDFLVADRTLSKAFVKAAGGPPDVVFECVGTPGAIERAAQLAGPRGTVLVLGACMMEERLQPIVPTMKVGESMPATVDFTDSSRSASA